MDFLALQQELSDINERAEQIRLALEEQRYGLMAGIREFVGSDEQTFRDLITELSILGQSQFDLTVMVRRPRVKLDTTATTPATE